MCRSVVGDRGPVHVPDRYDGCQQAAKGTDGRDARNILASRIWSYRTHRCPSRRRQADGDDAWVVPRIHDEGRQADKVPGSRHSQAQRCEKCAAGRPLRAKIRPLQPRQPSTPIRSDPATRRRGRSPRPPRVIAIGGIRLEKSPQAPPPLPGCCRRCSPSWPPRCVEVLIGRIDQLPRHQLLMRRGLGLQFPAQRPWPHPTVLQPALRVCILPVSWNTGRMQTRRAGCGTVGCGQGRCAEGPSETATHQ